MNLLVTGLCLSRNLGGAAMALALKDNLIKRIPNASFIYAIPDAFSVEEEQWAKYYGVDIVPRDTYLSFLLETNSFIRFARNCNRFFRKKSFLGDCSEKIRIHKKFMQAYKNCSAVINMMGINYIGDGTINPLKGMSSYSYLYYAKKYKKPFTHFIQTFGPFNDWKIRFVAKRDFSQVDFIPARGKESAEHCRSIVKNKSKVYDFPDIAILLPQTDEAWLENYLKNKDLNKKGYYVLCPSSVIYNLPEEVNGCTGEEYTNSFLLISKKLISNSENILFLPHMYSRNKIKCDRELCYRIYNTLKNENIDITKCKIVEDDIDVWQAKSLIANAKNAIVSRYHALVAALSTGVPAVAIGWNIKYQDLLDYYGMKEMSVDVRDYNSDQIAEITLHKLDEFKHKHILIEKLQKNEEKVNYALDFLSDWLIKKVAER